MNILKTTFTIFTILLLIPLSYSNFISDLFSSSNPFIFLLQQKYALGIFFFLCLIIIFTNVIEEVIFSRIKSGSSKIISVFLAFCLTLGLFMIFTQAGIVPYSLLVWGLEIVILGSIFTFAYNYSKQSQKTSGKVTVWVLALFIANLWHDLLSAAHVNTIARGTLGTGRGLYGSDSLLAIIVNVHIPIQDLAQLIFVIIAAIGLFYVTFAWKGNQKLKEQNEIKQEEINKSIDGYESLTAQLELQMKEFWDLKSHPNETSALNKQTLIAQTIETLEGIADFFENDKEGYRSVKTKKGYFRRAFIMANPFVSADSERLFKQKFSEEDVNKTKALIQRKISLLGIEITNELSQNELETLSQIYKSLMTKLDLEKVELKNIKSFAGFRQLVETEISSAKEAAGNVIFGGLESDPKDKKNDINDAAGFEAIVEKAAEKLKNKFSNDLGKQTNAFKHFRDIVHFTVDKNRNMTRVNDTIPYAKWDDGMWENIIISISSSFALLPQAQFENMNSNYMIEQTFEESYKRITNRDYQ